MTINQNTFERIDNKCDAVADKLRGNRTVDQLSYWVSHVAEFSILWQIIGLVTLLPFAGRRDEWLRLLTVLLFESVFVNQLVKRVTNRSRPAASTKLSTKPRRPSTTSLPSGHASSAFTAAVLLSASFGWAAPIWFTLAALVGLSRLHNRVHHATDIFAGALVGLCIGSIALIVVPL